MDDPKDDVQGPAHEDEDAQLPEGAAGEDQADVPDQDMGEKADSADTQEPRADGSPDLDTPPARRRPSRPLVAPSVAAALEAQWAGKPYPLEPGHYLVLSIAEDPGARPWIELLTGSRPRGLTAAWDEAQRASDRTMVGRLARPVVALEPRAYRWRVARVVGRSIWLPEGIDHANPKSALRAARTRFGELLRRRSLADDLDAIARTLDDLDADIDEAPPAAATEPTPPAAPEAYDDQPETDGTDR